jgi:hypothetical protein
MIYEITEFTVQADKIAEVQQMIGEFIESIKQSEPEVLRFFLGFETSKSIDHSFL